MDIHVHVHVHVHVSTNIHVHLGCFIVSPLVIRVVVSALYIGTRIHNVRIL